MASKLKQAGEAVADYIHPEWTPSRKDGAIALAAFILVPFVGGMLIGALLQKDTKTWYRTLSKPKWTPPTAFFGPVWGVLYVLMGYASWSVWTHGGFEKQAIPLGFYALYTALNFAWTPVMFKGHKLDLALLTILGVLGALSSTIVAFHHVEPLAAVVLVPNWFFLVFATFLTFRLYQLNPQKSRRTNLTHRLEHWLASPSKGVEYE
jgi:tryptophan-rich sensory protein